MQLYFFLLQFLILLLRIIIVVLTEFSHIYVCFHSRSSNKSLRFSSQYSNGNYKCCYISYYEDYSMCSSIEKHNGHFRIPQLIQLLSKSQIFFPVFPFLSIFAVDRWNIKIHCNKIFLLFVTKTTSGFSSGVLNRFDPKQFPVFYFQALFPVCAYSIGLHVYVLLVCAILN